MEWTLYTRCKSAKVLKSAIPKQKHKSHGMMVKIKSTNHMKIQLRQTVNTYLVLIWALCTKLNLRHSPLLQIQTVCYWTLTIKSNSLVDAGDEVVKTVNDIFLQISIVIHSCGAAWIGSAGRRRWRGGRAGRPGASFAPRTWGIRHAT